jgi:hypothetical protein
MLTSGLQKKGIDISLFDGRANFAGAIIGAIAGGWSNLHSAVAPVRQLRWY